MSFALKVISLLIEQSFFSVQFGHEYAFTVIFHYPSKQTKKY